MVVFHCADVVFHQEIEGSSRTKKKRKTTTAFSIDGFDLSFKLDEPTRERGGEALEFCQHFHQAPRTKRAVNIRDLDFCDSEDTWKWKEKDLELKT